MFNSNFKQSPLWALLLLIFIFYNNIIVAQINLFPNYSFENYTICPSASYNILPLPWYLSTTVLQNGGGYRNACDTGKFAGVPYNYSGGQNFQYARTGSAYYGQEYLNGTSRVYIQVKLIDSLKTGKCYYAEHYVNSPNSLRLACNNIGMLFTDSAIYADTLKSRYPPIIANPQVINYGNPIIADTLNWIKVSGIFKAKGGEQYLTLGNFADNAHTVTLTFQTNGTYGAGYCIDDVSVYDLDSFRLQADAGRDTVIKKGDSAWIGSYTNGIDTLNWIQNGVTVIDSIRPGFWVYPTTNTFYVLIQTVNGYTSSDTVWVTVAALPVIIDHYKLIIDNGIQNTVENVWVTSTEVNVSHFNVQRSIDGINFETVGMVKAKGAGEYSYTAPPPPKGGIGYYRLEVVDKNGALSYSEVKEIQLGINNYELRISPNPAKDFITISGGNVKEVRITDVSGSVLLKSTDKKVDIRSLVSGTYIVQIETLNGNYVTEKLIKLP